MRTIFKSFGLVLIGASSFSSLAMASAAPNVCPVAEAVVVPDVARQGASATVGMIADRVASAAAGIGMVGSSTPVKLGVVASCGQVALNEESSDSAFQPRLSAAETTAAKPQPNQTAPALDNGIWMSTTATWLKKTDPKGEFSGSVETAVVGFDRKVLPDTIVGIATGAESAFIRTAYNRGTIRGKSISISPYVGYAFTDWLTWDATLGHAWVYYNYTQDNGATSEILGQSHANRWFGSTDLTATDRIESTILRAALGYLRVSEVDKGFINTSKTRVATSSVNMGQLRATLTAGYEFAAPWGIVTPNAFVRLQYEVPHQGAASLATGYVSTTDTTSAVFGVSVDTVIDKVWTVSMFGSTEEFRQNTSARTLGLNARYSF